MNSLGVDRWPAQGANDSFLYLTTIGRRTGRPHRIEIWFAVHHGRLYLMSGGRDRSDWVRNLMRNPRVAVKLANEIHSGMARGVQPASAEDRLARDLLVAKYADGEDDLEEWGRTSLPGVIEFPHLQE
jgi:deazaflavin-dependent oxidoreductase (nitroreductase family)